VIQFKLAERWRIHKYHKYALAGPHQQHCKQVGEWVTMNELPAIKGPAPVVTGPGPGYRNGYVPETTDLKPLLIGIHQAIKDLSKAMGTLLKNYGIK